MSATSSALARLNERYRAPTIIVAIVEGDKDGGALSVGGIRYDTQTGARSEIAKVPVAGRRPARRGGQEDACAGSTSEWRSIAIVRRDSQDAIDVVVPIRALGDWVQVRQRLGGVPAVKSVVVRSLESDRAELHLEYFGTADELQRTLAQAGLRLDKEADSGGCSRGDDRKWHRRRDSAGDRRPLALLAGGGGRLPAASSGS